MIELKCPNAQRPLVPASATISGIVFRMRSSVSKFAASTVARRYERTEVSKCPTPTCSSIRDHLWDSLPNEILGEQIRRFKFTRKDVVRPTPTLYFRTLTGLVLQDICMDLSQLGLDSPLRRPPQRLKRPAFEVIHRSRIFPIRWQVRCRILDLV